MHLLILGVLVGVCVCTYLILDKLVTNKDVNQWQSSILTYSSSTWIYLSFSFSCGENFWPCENSKNTQLETVSGMWETESQEDDSCYTTFESKNQLSGKLLPEVPVA